MRICFKTVSEVVAKHFRTATSAFDRIFDLDDSILRDLSLPISRHAHLCIMLDLVINVCALLRYKIQGEVK